MSRRSAESRRAGPERSSQSAWSTCARSSEARSVARRTQARRGGDLNPAREAVARFGAVGPPDVARRGQAGHVGRRPRRQHQRDGRLDPEPQPAAPQDQVDQGTALKLVAKKLQSSLAVEGELPEDGLAAYGNDLMLALASKIVAGEEDADSVESVFAQAQQVAAEAGPLLVDDEWGAPERVSAELVMVGTGVDEHHDEVREPQRTLLS